MSSKLERRLRRSLIKNGVDVVWGREHVPKIVSPITHRDLTPDIYIPSVRLHVEVKGQMSVESIRQIVFLGRQNPRYYLFQGTLRQWAEMLRTDDVPSALSPRDMKAVRDYAWARQERYEAKHPGRRTKSHEPVSDANLAYSKAFQRKELILLAEGHGAVEKAGAITVARIGAYIKRWLGDLDLF